MGCDIHSIAQVKKNGAWTTVARRIAGDPRNYATFGLLAEVRACPRVSMGQPKGFPSDLVFKKDDLMVGGYNATIENMDMGDHSFSWHSLPDILAFIKDREDPKNLIKLIGFLTEKEYKEVVGTENIPEDYLEDLDLDGSQVILTGVQYNNLKKLDNLPNNFLIQYTWYESDIEFTSLKDIAKELQQIAKDNNVMSEGVRYIFGFDS